MPRLVQVFQLRVNLESREWTQTFLQRGGGGGGGAALVVHTLAQVTANVGLADRTRIRTMLVDCFLLMCDAAISTTTASATATAMNPSPSSSFDHVEKSTALSGKVTTDAIMMSSTANIADVGCVVAAAATATASVPSDVEVSPRTNLMAALLKKKAPPVELAVVASDRCPSTIVDSNDSVTAGTAAAAATVGNTHLSSGRALMVPGTADKYSKMRRNGLSDDVIRHSMAKDGIPIDEINKFCPTKVSSASSTAATAARKSLRAAAEIGDTESGNDAAAHKSMVMRGVFWESSESYNSGGAESSATGLAGSGDKITIKSVFETADADGVDGHQSPLMSSLLPGGTQGLFNSIDKMFEIKLEKKSFTKEEIIGQSVGAIGGKLAKGSLTFMEQRRWNNVAIKLQQLRVSNQYLIKKVLTMDKWLTLVQLCRAIICCVRVHA